MPPHCDAMDGPVVKAALAALAASDVGVVLPFVDEAGEAGVRALFDEVAAVRSTGGTAGEIAERLFLETVVRLHRATEGAPFTGLKPAGLDHGPVIPIAERAIVTGSPRGARPRALPSPRGPCEDPPGQRDGVEGTVARGASGGTSLLRARCSSCRCGRTRCTDPSRRLRTTGNLVASRSRSDRQGPSTRGSDDPISREVSVQAFRREPRGGGRR